MKTSNKNKGQTPSIEELLPLLKRLRLSAMSDELRAQIEDPATLKTPYVKLLYNLLEAEVLRRDASALNRRIREAGLRYTTATVEQIDYKVNRGLNKAMLESLASADWVRARQNIIITGPAGSGKTYVSDALANACLLAGMTVRFIRMPRLLKTMYSTHEISRGYETFLRDIKKYDLLILDDWGIGEMNALMRSDLLELIEYRYETGSLIITSVLPVNKWAEYIGDPTLADSILDRLVRKAHRITLKSDKSMRELKRYGAVLPE